jgi:hypothetical protein
MNISMILNSYSLSFYLETHDEYESQIELLFKVIYILKTKEIQFKSGHSFFNE